MTTNRVLTATALIAMSVFAPAPLLAQGAGAGAQSQSQAQAQASTPDARIAAALDAAARAEVPVSLIESKIAEGEAKGVARSRIAAAVEARVASLVRASEALERAGVEARSAGELAVTADALEAGVSEDVVVSVGRDAPAERRTVAIAVLADLVRLGNPTADAFARVDAALASSASLANLHAEVASQLRLGGLRSTLEAAGIIKH